MGLIYPPAGSWPRHAHKLYTVGVELFDGKAKFLQKPADQFLAARILGVTETRRISALVSARIDAQLPSIVAVQRVIEFYCFAIGLA